MILLRFNFDPCYIYSSLDPFARKEMIRKFRLEDAESNHNIMLVTDIAARGIDIPLLDCVVNFHFPPKVLSLHIIHSVKPLKSKNHDNVALDGTNPNLKKVLIEIFTRQPNLSSIMSHNLCGFLIWIVLESSIKI